MKLTLNALFDYTSNDGIFTYLNGFDVPWKNDVDSDLLDLDYHSKHGTKIVSKTVTSLITTDGLPTSNKTKLAKLLWKKNQKRWTQLWESIGLFDEANPLDNTDWTETRTLGHQGSDSKSQTIGAKETTYQKGSQTNSETIGQSTLTEGQQNNITGQQTISMEETKSAFNSSNYSPLDQKTEQLGQRSDTIGQKVNTDSGRSNSTIEGQRSDSTNEGAQSNSESGTNAFTDTETTSRHGNIGVTTTGQLIRDFRNTVNWQFFDIIYKDIDDMLVIEVYGKEDDDFDDYTIVTGYVLPVASASKLGGIKVGQNLQIASDGTLKAVVESGVDSVNGKTGVVTLDASDVGAASSSDLNSLANIVNSQGQTIGQHAQAIDGINTDIDGINDDIDGLEQDILNIRQVPTGGTTSQVLTKTSDGYGWGNIPGASKIALPYALVAYFPERGGGQALEWTLLDGNKRSYLFDLTGYEGRDFEFWTYMKSTAPLRACRYGFLPDVDLTVTGEVSRSIYCGAYYNGNTYFWPFIKAPMVNLRDSYGRWPNSPFNYLNGKIPSGMKYFVANILGADGNNPSSIDVYDNDFAAEFNILN